MEHSCLIVSVAVFVFLVHNSLQDCRIVQPSTYLQSYWCSNIKELERHGNSQLLNVNIHNGTTLPVLVNQTHTKTPHLQIVLADNSGEGLSPDTYRIIENLSKTILENNALRTIPKGIFENLPLQELHLHDNGIQSIQVGAFSNMPRLQELHITHNNLASIEVGIFSGLPVETLALSNNNISVIRKNALHNMKNLRHLHLDGNVLSTFYPEQLISFGSILETLLLQGNFLTELDRTTVRTLNNLRILNLSDNKISKIVLYAFENLLNLEELNLAYNQLEELNAEIFSVDGMPSLTKLEINDNKLSFLMPKFLYSLKKLKYIRLGGNPWTCPCYDDILGYLSDNTIQQFCDNDYHTGTRPVCVVPWVSSTTCDYTTTSFQFSSRFAETISETQVIKCDFSNYFFK